MIDTTHGPAVWKLRANLVHLVDASHEPSRPMDQDYWLILAHNPASGDHAYFASHAFGGAHWEQMMTTALTR